MVQERDGESLDGGSEWEEGKGTEREEWGWEAFGSQRGRTGDQWDVVYVGDQPFLPPAPVYEAA